MKNLPVKFNVIGITRKSSSLSSRTIMSDLVETGEPKPKSGAPSTVDLEAGGQH